ncbi:MAG: tRNA (guanosine(18)-2'-O)-methyltransferase [Bacteroidia bacterium]|nr:MAG: tRNA (guanosine(18)-2'-O)-methyltransferase [Bacteroidia bacterium]
MNASIEQQIDYLKEFITQKRFGRFLEVLNNRTRYITIVLEDVFQGHNAAAVLRSCDCFGIQDIHLIENRNEFKPNEEISLGASQWLSLYKYNKKDSNNTEICYETLREKGYKIVATSPHSKSFEISELSLDKPIALVFGAEKEGLSDYALKNADESVFISMYGFTESFNISVSAALCMYELNKKLRTSSINYHLSESEKQEILLQWLKISIKDSEKILEKYFSQIKN